MRRQRRLRVGEEVGGLNISAFFLDSDKRFELANFHKLVFEQVLKLTEGKEIFTNLPRVGCCRFHGHFVKV